MKLVTFLSLGILPLSMFAADAPMRLFPASAPGENAPVGEEKDMSKPGEGLVAGRPLIRLGNVSEPTLTVFRPAKEKDTGTTVVVCPGGGYHILAMDLEGTEVCEWLNSIGVTGVLVKYRVPARKERPRYEAPLQDAQRAISITRAHAAEWGIDPKRIGILGFSAGGHLAAVTSNTPALAYPAVDDKDKAGFLPDFTVLIYPAYLAPNGVVAPELPITEKTPPTFIAMSQDDPVGVEGALHYSLALRKAKVPFEMHIYPVGGHGYGLRRTDKDVTAWPERVADWMRSNGWLKK
jgi:acetyl esterase/lipase